MSSGGLRPQPQLISHFSEAQKLNPLVPFGAILPNTNPFALSQLLAVAASNSQRSKLKRCRQRVDAGEPRNSYQVSESVHLGVEQKISKRK